MMRFAVHAFVAILAAGSLLPAQAWAQRRSQVLTHPSTPKAHQLEALNLVLQWSVDLPMESKHDGIHDAWVVGGQVLVQTRRGTVVCLDAETGRQFWHVLPGQPYQVTLDLAWNNRHVFAFNNGSLHSIDRRSGAIDWRFPLGVTPSAPGVADNQQLYLAVEGEAIIAIYLPQPPGPVKRKRLELDVPRLRVGGGPSATRVKEKPNDVLADFTGAAPPPMGDGAVPAPGPGDQPPPAPAMDPKAPGTLRTVDDDVQLLNQEEPILNPKINWMFPTHGIVPFRPLITKDFVQGINYRGDTFTATKVGDTVKRTTAENAEVNLRINGRVMVQPVQHNKSCYLATDDGAVYALDIDAGTKTWERTLSFAPERPLFCTEDDLFVITKLGLTRLDARTGKISWTVNDGTRIAGYQPGMHNVVSVNPKFVYAFDRPGNMYIFDRKLGRELARVDWSDFNVPIPNRSTDRLFLASHSGKLVCLRDRDYLLAEFHGQGENVMEDLVAQKTVVDVLNQPSQIQEADGATLRDVLAQVASRHRLRIFFSDGAFRDQNLEPVANKKVKVVSPAKMSLGNHLASILNPLGATIANLGGVFMVVPKPGAAAATPTPAPAPGADAAPGEEKPPADADGNKKPDGDGDNPPEGADAANPKPAPAKPQPNKPAAKPGLPASPPKKPGGP